MNRQEWLNWRKIGSSDAAVIMKLFPFGKTPYQLWEERVNGKETLVNRAMQHGLDTEAEALDAFEKKTGTFLKRQDRIVNPKKLWMTATLDGIDRDAEVMVEMKCVLDEEKHETAKFGKVPEIYVPQCQHQMECAGYKRMFYASYHKSTQDLVLVEVQKDNQYVEKMVTEEEKFWNCILNWTAPELTDRDWLDLNFNPDWHRLAGEWKEVHASLKDLEAREERLRNELIAITKDRNAQGNGIRLTRSISKGNVDYSKVLELKNVNLEEYRKNSFEKWRLTAI